MKKQNKAFSLIELSIVVLVIGILIAGVVQGSKLYYKFKLQTARSLTQSSPVAGIKDLVMWLESTSTASFENGDQISDQAVISNWYDINPQRINKYSATTAPSVTNTAGYGGPTYLEKSINGLPALSFNGTNQGLIFSDSIFLNAPITAFCVRQNLTAYNTGIIQYILVRRNHFGLYDNNAPGAFVMAYGSAFILDSTSAVLGTNLITDTRPQIAVMTGSSAGANVSSSSVRTMSSQNSSWLSLTTSNTLTNDGTLQGSLGFWYYGPNSGQVYYNGIIAEIIVYNRVLTTEEITSVQNYLKQKWGI